MGYESKLYICKRTKIGKSLCYNEVLAAMNMSVMGSDTMAACVKLEGNLDGAISNTKSLKAAFHTRKRRKERNTILRSMMLQTYSRGTTCRWAEKTLSKVYAIQKKRARKCPMHSEGK